MSISIESRSGDPDTRALARRAEAAALRAADIACDAYRATLDESLRPTVRPDRVIAVLGGDLGDALASTVADLGSTAFAAARVTHLATEIGSDADAVRAGELAACAAEAAQAGARALAQSSSDSGPALVADLAHRAAMVAHLAADALAAYGMARPSISLVGSVDHPPVAFPPSWRARIEDLSRRLSRVQRSSAGESGAARDLLLAAEAAASAANHALRIYQRSGRGNGMSRATCRVTRIAALAACYAGCAALDMAMAQSPPR